MTEPDLTVRATPFESMTELREAHVTLLGRLDSALATDSTADGEAAAVRALEPDIRVFLERGAATGIFLDELRDRTACTALLEYWVSSLAQAGLSATATRLAHFDAQQLPDLQHTKKCPFVGLEAFREEDRRFFFGRETDTTSLLELIAKSPLVVVAGASGSGKSSLVMSGVLPKLAQGDQGPLFRIVRPVVPGNDILGHLTAAVRERVGGNIAPEESADLRTSPAALSTLIGGPDAVPVVITIDQFEEVFTLSSKDDREALVSNVARLLEANGKHRVILTMREEFRSRVTALRALERFLPESAWYLMRPMAYEDLRAAVDKPAAIVNLQFQAGIVDDLVKKVLGQLAALPLLQFTLLALWDELDRNRVTWEIYRQVGDPLTALPAAANKFYDGLAPESQGEVKRILLELVRVDELLEAYRQPLAKHVLLAAGKANTEDVLSDLSDHNYVRITRDASGDDVIEVKHEALIRNWPRYVAWIDERRLGLRQRLALTHAAERWQTRGRPVDELLAGWQLDEAKDYTDLRGLDAEFVRASQEQADRAQRERDNKLVADARRRLRVWLGLASGTIAFALVLAAAFWLQREAITLLAEMAGARRLAEEDPTAGAAAIDLAFETHRTISRLADARGSSAWFLNDERLRPSVVGAILSLRDEPFARARFSHSGVTGGFVIPGGLTPDGLTVVTRGRGDLQFWTAHGDRQDLELSPAGRLQDVVLDSMSGKVVAFWEDGSLRRFDRLGRMTESLKVSASPALPLGFDPRHGEQLRVDVVSAAFSRDGRRLVTAATTTVTRPSGATATAVTDYKRAEPETRCRVANVAGQTICELTLKGSVERVVPSSDGAQVVILRAGGALLWNAATNTTRPLQFESAPHLRSGRGGPGVPVPVAVRDAIFSKDDGQIAAIRVDGTVWVSAAGPASPPSLRLPVESVTSVAFSPDGELIATASLKGPTRLWTKAGVEWPQPDWLAAPATSVTFSQSGDRVVTTSISGSALVWQIGAGLVVQLKGRPGRIVSAAFFDSDAFILTRSDDDAVRLWRLDDRLATPLPGHVGSIQSLIVSRNGRRALTASLDNTARVWNLDSGASVMVVTHRDAVAFADFSPLGDRVVTASYDHTARIVDLSTASSRSLEGHSDWVLHSTFSPNGQMVVTSSADKTARLWSLEGRELKVLRGHGGIVNMATFSPDGQSVVTASDDGTVRLWDLSGGMRAKFDDTGPVGRVAFSPDGAFVLSATATATRRWSREEKPLPSEQGQERLLDVVFSVDGRYVLEAPETGKVRVRDTRTGQVLLMLDQGPAGPQSGEFSRSNELVATIARDGRLRIWSIAGELVGDLDEPRLRFSRVAFTPDGRKLLTASTDHVARIWPLTGAQYASRIAAIRLPCLTAAEVRDALLVGWREAQRLVQRCESRHSGR